MKYIFGTSILATFLAVLAVEACDLQNVPNSCRIDALCYHDIDYAVHLIGRSYEECHGLNQNYINNGGEIHVVYKNMIGHSIPPDFSMSNNYEFSARLYFIVELDLSENGWSSTPVIFTMPNLKKISLAKNQITDAKLFNEYILESLCELDLSHNTINSIDVNNGYFVYNELSYLNISNNYLINLPDAIFDSFPSLDKLDLSHNFIDTLGVMTFEGIKHLRYLDLSHNRISEPNLSLIRFSELEELYLDHNKIEEIYVRDFGRFTNLKILCLKNNYIFNIERNAFKMHTLVNIDLSDNKLEVLDKDSLSYMKNLQTVDISNNYIQILPKDIFKDNNISSVNLKGNSLRGFVVRGTFEGLKLIDVLDLSNQNLSGIDDFAFFGLEKLSSLLLSNNILETLSVKAFKELQHLKELDLSNNKISNISFDKIELGNLNSLILKNNLVSQIQKNDFTGLAALTFLDLSNNSIFHLETDSFKSLNSLINFEISNNPLAGALEENTFDGLNSLPNLDISQTLFVTIKNGSFSGMAELRDLNMSHSKINELQFNAFIHENSIKSLDLSFNKINNFNINTSSLFHLQTILLNDNLLHVISSNAFKGLLSLIKIDISCNSIQNINDDAFDDQIQDLRYLDLSYNVNLKLNMSVIQKAQSLYNLFLSGIQNDFKFSKVAQGKIMHLEITHSNKDNITKLELQNLQQLTNLDLSNNNVTKVEASALIGLKQLTELNLSFNKISSIQPGAFKENSLLYKLNVSHNELRTVSYGIFRGLIYLHTLDLSYNQIRSLKSERFYEVRSLSVLIADHNKIDFVSSEEFSGTNLGTLSIGDNPIPCETLVSLKKYGTPFAITAIRIDNDSENVDGVTCNIKTHGTDLISPHISEDKGEKLIENMRILLFNSSRQFGDSSNNVLQEIRDILLNSSHISNYNRDELNLNKSQSILNYLANMTRQIENNQKESNNLFIEEVNKTNNLFIDRTSLLLNKMRQNVLIPTKAPPGKDSETGTNLTNFQLLSYINKVKQDSDDTLTYVNNKVFELENKIRTVGSRLETQNRSLIDTYVFTTFSPKHEKLFAEKETTDYKEQRSMLFTETCVGLILLILVCSILYRLYKSNMFVPTRRSMSTREIVESMESSNL